MPNDLGSTDATELRATADTAYGARPDPGQNPRELMSEHVLAVAKKRLEHPARKAEEIATQSFAVFLFTDDLRNDRTRLKAVHTPALGNAGQRLSGSTWIVPPTLASGARLPIDEPDLGKVFELVEAIGLGDRLAAVVDFSVPELRIYERGVRHDTDVVRLPIALDDLEVTSLSDLLKDFAEQFLATPNAQPASSRIWSDGGSYVPVQCAEKKIQDYLETYLRARLLNTHKIETEYPLISGRADVVINRKGGGGVWQKLAVVELKVARSRSSRNKPTALNALLRHTLKGYKQVQAYRAELDALEGYLVIYDMRSLSDRANDLLAPYVQDAPTKKIVLRCDGVYGTADDYRDATIPVAEPAAS